MEIRLSQCGHCNAIALSMLSGLARQRSKLKVKVQIACAIHLALNFMASHTQIFSMKIFLCFNDECSPNFSCNFHHCLQSLQRYSFGRNWQGTPAERCHDVPFKYGPRKSFKSDRSRFYDWHSNPHNLRIQIYRLCKVYFRDN